MLTKELFFNKIIELLGGAMASKTRKHKIRKKRKLRKMGARRKYEARAALRKKLKALAKELGLIQE